MSAFISVCTHSVGLGGVVRSVLVVASLDDASLDWLPQGLHWLDASVSLAIAGQAAIV